VSSGDEVQQIVARYHGSSDAEKPSNGPSSSSPSVRLQQQQQQHCSTDSQCVIAAALTRTLRLSIIRLDIDTSTPLITAAILSDINFVLVSFSCPRMKFSFGFTFSFNYSLSVSVLK